MTEEVAFKNNRISNFEQLMTLTMTLERVVRTYVRIWMDIWKLLY